MDTVKKMSWLVGVLTILNLVLIGFLLWPHLRRNHPPGPPDQNLNREADAFMERQIGMSPDQVAAFEKSRRETKAEFDSLRDQLGKRRQGLTMTLFETSPGQASADRFLDEIASCSRRLEALTFEHLRDIHARCNPEQKTRFKSLLEEVFRESERMRKPPRPPRQGGDDHE